MLAQKKDMKQATAPVEIAIPRLVLSVRKGTIELLIAYPMQTNVVEKEYAKESSGPLNHLLTETLWQTVSESPPIP